MTTPLRCLIVEDSADDARLLLHELRAGGYDVTSERVDSPEAMRAALERQPWDIVLSDYRMPRFNGMEALELLRATNRELPFILVSGTVGEETAVAAMKAGANDYLLKDRLTRLVPAVQRELRDAVERHAHQQADDALRKMRWLQAEIERIGHVGGWEFDIDTKRQVWTEEVYRIHEVDRTFQPDVDVGISFYTPESQPIIERAVQRAIELGEPFDLELEIITAQGNRKSVHTIGKADLPSRKIHGFFQDITERKLAEEKVSQLALLVGAAPNAILVHDFDGRFLFANERAFALHGYSREEFLALNLRQLDVPEDERLISGRMKELRERGEASFEVAHFRKDGSTVPFFVAAKAIKWAGEDAILSVSTDISERKRSEAAHAALNDQLRQAQKMESIGLLAGGVAHDFNNMLAAITGNAELAIRKASAEHPATQHLQAIHKAAQRAAKLTGQLLVFARKQPPSTTVLDLNTVIEGILTMLNPLLGEQVNIEWAPAGGLWSVAADAAQMEQVMTNLAINARDAKNGNTLRLRISTANVQLDTAFLALRALAATSAGEYVRLRVQDDGVGMDASTMSRMFDPFFTTKAPGKGTGLGLSTVIGIVQQHGGFIDVESTPEVGTTFSLYLPRSLAPAGEITDPRKSVPRGTENILLAEDEDGVRHSVAEMLKMLGYIVRGARDGEEAARVFDGEAEHIQLLLTDVIMTGINGAELRDALVKKRPDLKVLFMSGYTSDIMGIKGVLEPGVHFVRKPFSLSVLANAVRRALDT